MARGEMATVLRDDPASGGFYTISEVSRYLGIERRERVRRWVVGYDCLDPIVLCDYKPVSRTQELSFLDLIEVRFIQHFRRQGVSLQSIRAAAKAARRELEISHPFAASHMEFVTDRKRIFLHTAEKTGDERLLDIVRGQYAMYEVMEKLLAKGLTFDPDTLLAERWYPDKGNYPKIVLDPHIAFGQSTVEPFGVPTKALFEAWRANDGSSDVVAEWFEVEPVSVEQAVDYELTLEA